MARLRDEVTMRIMWRDPSTWYRARARRSPTIHLRLCLVALLMGLALSSCGGPIVKTGDNAAGRPTPTPCPDSMSCKAFKRLEYGKATPTPEQ
jgi:hypothetical protein